MLSYLKNNNNEKNKKLSQRGKNLLILRLWKSPLRYYKCKKLLLGLEVNGMWFVRNGIIRGPLGIQYI